MKDIARLPVRLWGRCVVAVVAMLGCVTVAAAEPAASWKLLKQSEGTQVYSRPVEGSSIDELRIVTRMKASLPALVALLRDYEARPRWDSMCGEVFVHQRVGAREEIVYVQTRLPWPVTDRDLVMRSIWSLDPASGAVTLRGSSANDAIPPRAGRVRMPTFRQMWTVIPLGAGQVSIESVVHADPGGPLPGWLINQMSADAPLQAMQKMRAILAEPKYAGADLSWLQDS